MTTKPLPAFLLEYSESGFTNPHEVTWPDMAADCRGRFTHIGAQYSGYETARHHATTVLEKEKAFAYDHDAHHWILIGLRERAEVNAIDISTKWFTGNQVRAASVYLIDGLTGKKTQVLDRVSLNPDAEHHFDLPKTFATECLVECYYEGGIARVHLFGEMAKDQMPPRRNLLEDATISHISNDHYGTPAKAVNGNRVEHHMVGWESARTGFGEQALFHLKKPTVIDDIVVDTYLHRLNAPLSSHIFALHEVDTSKIEAQMQNAPRWKLVFGNGHEVVPPDFRSYMLEQKYLQEKVPDTKHFKIMLHHSSNSTWQPLLPFAPLTPDHYHRFKAENAGSVTHVLYMHYPNGGIHGLKMFEKL